MPGQQTLFVAAPVFENLRRHTVNFNEYMLVKEFRHFNQLRATDGEQIVVNKGEHTREQFEAARIDPDAVPVIIPAQNEAEHLPATLLTIAESEVPLIPIVVVNGPQKDNTEELANEMGAKVLIREQSGSIGAKQDGIRYIEAELGSRGILTLFTDADTLVRPGWAGRMRQLLHENDIGTGVNVWGRGIYTHGKSKAVDVLRSTAQPIKQSTRRALGKLPRGMGYNCGLLYDPNGAMKQEIFKLELDPRIFLGEDIALRDAVHRAGAHIVSNLGFAATVVTMGDRMGSLRDLLQSQRKRDAARIASYREQYPDMVVYKSTIED